MRCLIVSILTRSQSFLNKFKIIFTRTCLTKKVPLCYWNDGRLITYINLYNLAY